MKKIDPPKGFEDYIWSAYDVETYEPMEVSVVETETGPCLEPQLDPTWKCVDKLRWRCGAQKAVNGITINIHARPAVRFAFACGCINKCEEIYFNFSIGSTAEKTQGSLKYSQMACLIDGIGMGFREAISERDAARSMAIRLEQEVAYLEGECEESEKWACRPPSRLTEYWRGFGDEKDQDA